MFWIYIEKLKDLWCTLREYIINDDCDEVQRLEEESDNLKKKLYMFDYYIKKFYSGDSNENW